MRIVIISIPLIPKCNICKSIHRSLPGHVNSRSRNQGQGLGHSLLKEEIVQHSGRKYPVGNFICMYMKIQGIVYYLSSFIKQGIAMIPLWVGRMNESGQQ